MTIAALGLAWVALAALVSRPGVRLIARLRPGMQASAFLGASAGLAIIPPSALIVLLSRALYSADMTGSFLDRCGKLLTAVFARPLERPGITAAVALLLAGAVGVTLGAVAAWRSQRSCGRLVRGRPGSLVLVPGKEMLVFTTGMLKPKIVVSTGFMDSTDEDCRRVVLAHEDAHRRGHHPLVLMVAETLARGVPLPPLRWAAEALALALEMLADEKASKVVGSRELVAEAVASQALAPVPVGVAFEGDAVRRVRRLLADPLRGRATLGLALVGAVVAILGFSGGHAVHCADAALNMLRMEGCRVHLSMTSGQPSEQ